MSVVRTGPAAPGWPTSGAVVDADRIHLLSRNLEGTRVAEVDLDTRTLVREVVIPTGDGAWGTVLAPDGVYLGLFGARGRGNLQRLAGGRATTVAALDVDYIWDLAVDSDGTVYGVGTGPSLVFRYDPRTRKAAALGMVAGAQQPRTCTVVNRRLVIGGTATGRAFLIDRAPSGSAVRNLLPPDLADDQTVYCSAATTDGRIVIGTAGRNRQTPAIAIIDPADPSRTHILRLPREALVDTVAVSGSALHATARPSGALYRTDLGARNLTRVAVPVPLSETRRLIAGGGTVVGASADGTLWSHDTSSRRTSASGPSEIGLAPGRQRVQSICAAPGHVDVGGSFSVTRHPTGSGRPTTRFVPGEPKAMVRMGTTTYLAMYPTAELWAWPDGADAPQRLATLQTDQLRPIGMAALERLDALVCTTTDDLARSVVHTVDPVSGRVDTLVNPLGAQTVAGVHVSATTIYVGGSGREPGVAAFDALSGARLWTVPNVIPGGGFVLGLQAVGTALAVSTSAGWFTTIDLRTRRAAPPARVAQVGGQLRRVGREVLLATGDAVLQIEPVSQRVVELAGGLDGQFWAWPPMDVDAAGRVWTVAGRELARVESDVRA